MKRYYIQYAEKEHFEDRYIVIDARTNQPASVERLPYAQAKERMKWLEENSTPTDAPYSPWAGGWRG